MWVRPVGQQGRNNLMQKVRNGVKKHGRGLNAWWAHRREARLEKGGNPMTSHNELATIYALEKKKTKCEGGKAFMRGIKIGL